jgi:hypothetical protein
MPSGGTFGKLRINLNVEIDSRPMGGGLSMVDFILSAWPLAGLGLAIAANIVWVMALVYSLHVF